MSSLSPTQQRTFDELQAAWPHHDVVTLGGSSGVGKTTILRAFHRTQGGGFLTVRDFFDAQQSRHPLALEETLDRLMSDALARHPHVVLDDLHLIDDVVAGCGAYPRAQFIGAALAAIIERATQNARKFLTTCHYWPAGNLGYVGRRVAIADFQPEDYAFFGRRFLGEDTADRLDFAKIHRFAPALNAQQWKLFGAGLDPAYCADTETFIEYLRSHHLTSNVDLTEVQPVSLQDLRGVDEVVRALETHIVLPLQDSPLAERLQLRPKRGVLLVGPPGTGKTTVGRALAHRLKGKFFLIDGTCISGTQQFYRRVAEIYEGAKRNAPAVIFIDDSDVIFESGELGLYRYLLTMLDGLESASAGRVCLMLTAMDVSHLPPALLRSGRVELWLEMKLPDTAAREGILRQHVEGLPEEFCSVDIGRVAAAADGCTGADLKRLSEDARNLLAADLATERPVRSVTDYLLAALASLRLNKERYESAERAARQRRPERPVYFDVAMTDAADGDGSGAPGF